MYQITAPHFVAGFEVDRASSICNDAAPIIKWVIGRHLFNIMMYCKREGWGIKEVTSGTRRSD
jgi:hypothetical protein